MIKITSAISLNPAELSWEFVRSSGPGGQNVNKVATAAQLRFDAKNSQSLPETVRERLLQLAGSRATKNGEIIIDARTSRSQEQNREDALNRLVSLIRQAAIKPRSRIKTRPPAASRRRRMEKKRLRSEKKRLRGPVGDP
ncbi:MAG: alternative ribosome rescue aminoacyl-tRNA hydrolase ArfB [Desulfatibacillaceae bacterium]|nr:alternative ribosome rescue aminoacyl-tRNA hydrolase ArfB [Desulfatibacillaceae bacterium]